MSNDTSAHSLWKKVITCTTYLKNRSPTHVIKDHKVPDEVFWGKKPNMSNLEEFGKTCWVLQQNGKNSKLNLKSRQFIFVGVADGTKGYRYYNKTPTKSLSPEMWYLKLRGKIT